MYQMSQKVQKLAFFNEHVLQRARNDLKQPTTSKKPQKRPETTNNEQETT